MQSRVEGLVQYAAALLLPLRLLGAAAFSP